MIRFGKSKELFQEFYRTHYGRVRRTLSGMTGNFSVAEELTQEAFLKAWKGLPHFGFKSTLSTWIFQVAINVGRDWLRAHKTVSYSEGEAFEERGLTPEQRAVQESLLDLDEDARVVLILHYYEGMKIQEIGSVLKLPSGTIKSRLHSSKAKLKSLLLSKGFDV
ncbi:MAG: RNA polymerase sigma factor [Bacteriovoracia bacterium]